MKIILLFGLILFLYNPAVKYILKDIEEEWWPSIFNIIPIIIQTIILVITINNLFNN